MVLLDFKLKVPPHLSQKHLLVSKPKDSKSNTSTKDDSKTKECDPQKWVLPHHSSAINMICLLTLIPLILDSLPITSVENRQQLTGCLHLLISPITTPCIYFFNLQHRNSKKFTFTLAISSVFLGNITGMVYCSKCNRSGSSEAALVCLSVSLMLGTFQLLMLINKKNIATVMISTASSVVVCGLCIAALFLPVVFTRRCYQSTIPCIIWLFWQAMRNQDYGTEENFKSDIVPLNIADTI